MQGWPDKMIYMRKSLLYKGAAFYYQLLPATHPDKQRDTVITLILIHGFPESGSIFSHQIKALQKYYTLLIPDLPGSGASDFNASLKSLSDFSEALHHITREEHLTNMVIIGHSMGGYIALDYAKKYQESLIGIGLLHSTAYEDSPQKKQNRLKAISTMERFGGSRFLRAMIPTLFGEEFRHKQEGIIAQLMDQGAHFKTEALQQYYQIMHDRNDSLALLKELKVPVLFIAGSEDNSAPAGDLIHQSSLTRVSMIEVLEQVGHMGFLENPDKVNQILLSFLQFVQTQAMHP